MYILKKISKLRNIIFLILFAIGFLPLTGLVVLNMPTVINKMTEIEEEKQIEQIMRQFYQTRQVIEKRKESIRVLSLVPGARDQVDNNGGPVSSSVVVKRMTRMLIDWFSDEKDVFAISIIDPEGHEKFRLKRDGKKLVTSSPAVALTESQAEAFRESKLNKPGDIFIGDIQTRVRHLGDEHIHELIIYIGIPIIARKTKATGVLLLELDLKHLLPKTGIKYLISGNGTYYVNHAHNTSHTPDIHEHAHNTAFDDFKDLRTSIEKKSNCVAVDRQGIKHVWAVLIIDNDQKHCLWAGRQIDRSKVLQWVHNFLGKFIFIFGLFTLLIIIVASLIAINCDRLKKQLTLNLENLLNNNKPLELSWHWPRELHELGRDLISLSDRYLEISGHRKQAELELKEVNDRLEMILNSIAEGILGLDNDGEITFANQAAVRMFGFTAVDELVSNDLHSLLHFLREDRSQYPTDECPFCRAIATGKVEIEAEDIFWKKDGTSIHVQYLSSPIYDDKGIIAGTVMCIRDISEKKLAEEKMASLQNQLIQSQKMEAIGTLAGGVAHDFNNLLTHITGYSDIMLLEIAEDDPLRNHIKIIQDAARRAGGLTRQLLTFCRKQSMMPQVLNLNLLVQNIDKMLRRFIGENITLENHLSPHATIVNADPGMIEQVLMNLVINARDAMPNGGQITISTELTTLKEKDLKNFPQGRIGDFVCLQVADNGNGIGSEAMKRIFDPFFTTKGIGKGTGLGLSVVYGIIQQHDGWITASSTPDKGTEFSIYLQYYQGNNRDSDKINQENIPLGHGERILLLEDENNVRDIAEKILSMYGYQVYCAATMQEAQDLFAKEKGRFELVFSDIVLPDGTGMKFVEYILTKKSKIALLMTSGYTDDRAQLALIKSRDIPFLQKPYTRMELLKAVHDLLSAQDISL
jgi:PAS domain S-box-containing protein